MNPKLEKYINYVVDSLMESYFVFERNEYAGDRFEALFFTNDPKEDNPNWFYEKDMSDFDPLQFPKYDMDDALITLLQENYGVREEEAVLVYKGMVRRLNEFFNG